MKAVILPTGNESSLNPLTSWFPEYLIPIVNKPIVEHAIELLVRHDIKDIILVLKHMPYETENYFGKGERWGARISYSLEREYKGISNTIQYISSRFGDEFLFFPSNVITNINITDLINSHSELGNDLTISASSIGNGHSLSTMGQGKKLGAFSPFIMNTKAMLNLLQHEGCNNLEQILGVLKLNNFKTNLFKSNYAISRVDSIEDFFEVNKLILRGNIKGIILPGRQINDGIWIGKNTRIHVDAKLKSPILIGDNCIIRNGAAISDESIINDNVIIDNNSRIENSIILKGTYAGPQTEIKNSIARKNNLFSIHRNINTFINDEFILGDVEKKSISDKSARIFNILIAFIILIILSPVLICLLLYNLLSPSKKLLTSENCFGNYEVVDLEGKCSPKNFRLYLFRSSKLIIKKLPGLFNVIKGNLNLVGHSPLYSEEINSYIEEWWVLRSLSPVGLFSLAELESNDETTDEEKLAIDNYYAVTRTFWSDMKIIRKSFFKLT